MSDAVTAVMEIEGYTFESKDGGINWSCPGTAYAIHKGIGRMAEWKASYTVSLEDDTDRVSVRLVARAVSPGAAFVVLLAKVNAELERLCTYATIPEDEE